MTRLKQIAGMLLKLAIAAGLIGWILWKDFDRICSALLTLSPWAAAGCGLMIGFQITLTAWRWQYLLRMRGYDRIPFRECFELTYQGCFANLFLPGGAVGGDVVKAAIIARRMPEGRKLEAALSILIDRIVGMCGLFAITLLAFLVFLPEILHMKPLLRTTALVLGAGAFCGLVCSGILFFQDVFFRWSPAKALLDWTDRLLKGAPRKVMDAVAAYRPHGKKLLFLVLFSALVLHPLLIAAAAVPLYAASEQRAPSLPHTAAAVLFSNTASAVPLTPGGFGARDLTAREFYCEWGAEPGAASAAVLVYTGMLLLNDLLGGIFFLLPGRKKKEQR